MKPMDNASDGQQRFFKVNVRKNEKCSSIYILHMKEVRGKRGLGVIQNYMGS